MQLFFIIFVFLDKNLHKFIGSMDGKHKQGNNNNKRILLRIDV